MPPRAKAAAEKEVATNPQMNLIQTIFTELSKEIPPEAIQEKTVGNPTSGYAMGYLIERLNNVLYPLGCTWKTEIIPIERDSIPSTFIIEELGGDKSLTTVSVHVKVTIYDPAGNPILEKESFGGCQIINRNLGDSLKGAQTDALKKAFSYLGLGNEAFKGNIEIQKARDVFKRKKYLTLIAKDLIQKTQSDTPPSTDDMIAYLRRLLEMEISSLDDLPTSLLEQIAEELPKDTNRKGTKVNGKEKVNPVPAVATPAETPDKSIYDDDTPPF